MDEINKIKTAIDPDELQGPPAKTKILRVGFTTGTAATAAAVAAVSVLTRYPMLYQAEVKLPCGEFHEVCIAQSSLLNMDEAIAVVIKNAGDDPDITNGAEIGAIVRRLPQPGLINIIGGKGVGRVTKPGLILPPGQWAINPGPRDMLRENLKPFLSENCPGIEVEIFVEQGEVLALKTLNPRLGILGGISILGTTGLVKPFSHEAYVTTIANSLDVASAAGLAEVILTTGRQSEDLAQAFRPDLPQESFIQIADFFGDSLQLIRNYNFKTVGLACFFGKAVKQAAGHFNTHAHRNDQDIFALTDWLTCTPGYLYLAENLRESITARGALEVLRKNGALHLVELVAIQTLIAARGFLGSEPQLWISIFDYDGCPLVHRKDQSAQ